MSPESSPKKSQIFTPLEAFGKELPIVSATSSILLLCKRPTVTDHPMAGQTLLFHQHCYKRCVWRTPLQLLWKIIHPSLGGEYPSQQVIFKYVLKYIPARQRAQHIWNPVFLLSAFHRQAETTVLLRWYQGKRVFSLSSFPNWLETGQHCSSHQTLLTEDSRWHLTIWVWKSK